jgi:hypothetical protein
MEGVSRLDSLKSMLSDLEKMEEKVIETNPFKVFPKPAIKEALKLLEEYSEEFKI